MTKEEVQAVLQLAAEKRKDHHDTVERLLRTGEADPVWHEGVVDGIDFVTLMLTAALEKSEAALCGECGFLLTKHPSKCVYQGTAEQRARGEVPS